MIEDDFATQTRLVSIFRRKGYDVRGASSLFDGFEMFKEKRPDCILLDLHFPDGHGLEDFYTRILRYQEKYSEYPVPLIILTASDAQEDIGQLIRSGIYAIHSKNDPIDMVEASIQNEINAYKKQNLRLIQGTKNQDLNETEDEVNEAFQAQRQLFEVFDLSNRRKK